ncbi:MAG: DUF2202 domain-containing protein [Burkholderiaceae bacterium]|nr:DUF2202 domain-containing protein [Burkholderiaceae bacterium]
MAGHFRKDSAMEQLLSPRFMQDRHQHRIEHMAAIRQRIQSHTAQTLSAEEEHDLLHMREEEKIARDVYLQLGERWGLRPFVNISGAEQAHMDAIAALLAHYNLPDPAQGLAVGEFRTPDFQVLHNRLVESGLRSELSAIQVGLLIEELDIFDLVEARSRARQPEILAVYDDLERGSRNHLRAFFRHLQRHGGEYVPQYMSQTDFEAVAWSEREEC